MEQQKTYAPDYVGFAVLLTAYMLVSLRFRMPPPSKPSSFFLDPILHGTFPPNVLPQ